MKISPPAFPTWIETDSMAHGMSLRDYFAAAAMPLAYKYWMEDYYHPNGVGVNEEGYKTNLPREGFSKENKNLIAYHCYLMADAMMKARNK